MRTDRSPCARCHAPNGAHTFGCKVPRERFGWSAKTARRRKVSSRHDQPAPSGSSKTKLSIDGPTVINRHHYRGKRMPELWLYIGRNDRQPSKASPLRNPFDVRKHGAEAMDLYREHLRRQVEDGDAVILAELRKITASTHLVCSCAPRPCHGDVVVEVWRELAGSGRLAAR